MASEYLGKSRDIGSVRIEALVLGFAAPNYYEFTKGIFYKPPNNDILSNCRGKLASHVIGKQLSHSTIKHLPLKSVVVLIQASFKHTPQHVCLYFHQLVTPRFYGVFVNL